MIKICARIWSDGSAPVVSVWDYPLSLSLGPCLRFHRLFPLFAPAFVLQMIIFYSLGVSFACQSVILLPSLLYTRCICPAAPSYPGSGLGARARGRVVLPGCPFPTSLSYPHPLPITTARRLVRPSVARLPSTWYKDSCARHCILGIVLLCCCCSNK